MIQKQSYLTVSDNSGAREVLCLRVLPGIKKIATAGDVIVTTIKKAFPSEALDANITQKTTASISKQLIKKADIVLAAIIRIKAFLIRDNGFIVAFDKNACILIKIDKTPRGTRIFGPVAKEIKKKSLEKVVSLAAEIV